MIPNKQNMKSRDERDFLFSPFVYTKALLAKECFINIIIRFNPKVIADELF